MKAENIIWEDYMFNVQGQPIDPIAKIKDVEKVENKLNIKFPKDFLDVSTKHQGQYVDNLCVNVRSMVVGFGNFFLFAEHDGKYGSGSTIEFLHECMHQDDDKHKLLIPFAHSYGNSTFCFDYRKSLDNPSVVFYYSDREIEDDAITVLANSFTEFLEMLYEDEE